MTRRSARRARVLARHSLGLSIAAPQVIAHRLARLAIAGTTPSARDVAELQRMGAEKLAAFAEAWQSMTVAAMRAQQSYLASLVRSTLTPWWIAPPSLHGTMRRANDAAMGMLAAGIAPIHRKAAANARRLGRRRRG